MVEIHVVAKIGVFHHHDFHTKYDFNLHPALSIIYRLWSMNIGWRYAVHAITLHTLLVNQPK
jgi:hypothetical protein